MKQDTEKNLYLGEGIKGVCLVLAFSVIFMSGCAGTSSAMDKSVFPQDRSLSSKRMQSDSLSPEVILRDNSGTVIEFEPIGEKELATLFRDHKLVNIDSITVLTFHSHICYVKIINGKAYEKCPGPVHP